METMERVEAVRRLANSYKAVLELADDMERLAKVDQMIVEGQARLSDINSSVGAAQMCLEDARHEEIEAKQWMEKTIAEIEQAKTDAKALAAEQQTAAEATAAQILQQAKSEAGDIVMAARAKADQAIAVSQKKLDDLDAIASKKTEEIAGLDVSLAQRGADLKAIQDQIDAAKESMRAFVVAG